MSYKTTRKGKEGKRKRKGSEWGCVGLLVLQKTSICCDEGCRWGSQRLQCAQGGKPGFRGKHSKNRNVVFWGGGGFTAQLTRQEVLQRGSGHGNIRRTEKKSNAYFGKTLVRLACNQEKNKEQKNQIEKWNPKMKQTARRNSWQYQQKSWTVFIRWYVLSLWHVAAAAAVKRETACTVWCGEMKTISKTQRRSAETDEAKAKKEMECDGLHLLWEYLTFKDLN